MMILAEKLKQKSRTRCYGWIKGKMPPYATMQEVYYKAVRVAKGDEDGK